MLIRKLLDVDGVECREGPLEADAIDHLHPEERAAIARAVPARQQEYATARVFARTLLCGLGIADFPLLGDEERAPVWPESVVGSIAHTRRVPGGYCAVAIARKAAVDSIGIDLEAERSLSPRLWPKVLVEDERSRLDALHEDRRASTATLIWSAKEAFYKLQFPITRRLLGYDAVCVDIDESTERFRVRLRIGVGDPFAAGTVLEGRYALAEGLVATAMSLRR